MSSKCKKVPANRLSWDAAGTNGETIGAFSCELDDAGEEETTEQPKSGEDCLPTMRQRPTTTTAGFVKSTVRREFVVLDAGKGTQKRFRSENTPFGQALATAPMIKNCNLPSLWFRVFRSRQAIRRRPRAIIPLDIHPLTQPFQTRNAAQLWTFFGTKVAHGTQEHTHINMCACLCLYSYAYIYI